MSTDRADYSGIFQETDWWIDLVVHRVVLKVDETGTEAAGATAMTMVRSMGEPASIPFRMIVDRPFLIAIRHLETGALLFVGYIADPVEIGS
jgi:serpin B